MEPVLTMVIGLDGSGREDVQAEGTRVRTAEEAVRLVKGGTAPCWMRRTSAHGRAGAFWNSCAAYPLSSAPW